MTADEFQAAAVAVLRSTVGWQTAIARRLDIEPRTVRRWLRAGHTPDWVPGRMAELMGGIGASPWPRDEWLVGNGVTATGRRREYIAHLVPPRFVARIVGVDDDGLPAPDEEPADVLAGVVYSSEGYLLCEIAWVDEVTPGQITHLLDAACDAIDGLDEVEED